MWSLGSVIDRAYAEVNNTKFPLRTVPSEGTDPADFEAFVDRASPKAVVGWLVGNQRRDLAGLVCSSRSGALDGSPHCL